MIFRDRKDAGIKLAAALKKYHEDPNAVVIGLPRGGVVNAYEVAKELKLPLDVVFPRKVGAPFHEELAIGAVTETGEGVFNDSIIAQLNIPQEYIERTVEKEKAVAQKRLKMYRQNREKIALKGKTVIIVDDGLATGATMKAAIQSVKKEDAGKIVVAVPVAPPDTVEDIRKMVDEIVVLHAPVMFYAVGQFYEDFSPTDDAEVIALLQDS